VEEVESGGTLNVALGDKVVAGLYPEIGEPDPERSHESPRLENVPEEACREGGERLGGDGNARRLSAELNGVILARG
jgi:hypothetical protein